MSPVVHRGVFLVALFLIPGFAGSAFCQEEPPAEATAVADETAFSEETDVVAVDRLVGLKGTAGWLRGGKLPRKLDHQEFRARIVLDDEAPGSATSVAMTSVALEALIRGLPEMAEPWRIVVLVDSELASTRTVRWACSLLAERAEKLTSLGDVTVAMAGDDLRTVLLPTRDAVAVRDLFSRLALVAEGEHSVLADRWRWVEQEGDEGRGDPRRVAQDEISRLRGSLEARLLFLTDGTRNAGARRLLLWITDGFDLAPARFYGVDLPEPDLLAEFARDGFRALSADGWIALTLAPPDEDPYRGKAVGVRIGTWRFIGVPFLFAGVHEPDRDPERSEAYLELGDQRLAAGDVEGAADAYDRAYYHYWGDPETGDRQAVALLRLSDCLWTLGDRDAARRARALAAELDPEIAARHLATDTLDPGGLGRPEVARLLDPEAPLRLLTEATSGALVAKSSDLDDQLFDLRRRLRLTLQLPSELPQGLYLVKIKWRGESVMAPGWLRVGESAAVVEARSRR